MDNDAINDFWARLKSVNAGLLGLSGAAARLVPMSHQLRDADATLWFITAKDTDLARAVAMGEAQAEYVLADGSKGLYAVVTGTLAMNQDPAVLNDIWSTVADSWFDGGKDDPDVCVLGLMPGSAEVWLTPTSGLSFAFGILHAQLTGQQPDMGSHGKISGNDLAKNRLAA